MTTFSLLHATHRSGLAAEHVRATWLQRSDSPELVEHIFAFDEDDAISIACEPIASTGIAGPAMPGKVTAVRNWNAAGNASTGDILIVIADDLLPPNGWDRSLAEMVVDLDPLRAPFVINVRDSDDVNDGLIRHPIVSRRYFERYGLFDPAYEGIGVDNDFTLTAFRRGLVIDGRAIALDHQHPSRGSNPSESHLAMSANSSLSYGKQLFDRRWPRYKRHLIRRYLRPRPKQQTISYWTLIVAGLLSRLGYVIGVLPPRLRGLGRRLLVRRPPISQVGKGVRK